MAEIDREFSMIASTILVLVQNIQSNQVTRRVASLHKETLKLYLRGFIDRFWRERLSISEACEQEGKKDNLNLRQMEPRQLPKEVRRKYHLEHYLPVADLRTILLEMKSPTADKIAGLIAAAPIKKVWVLRDEDSRLKKYNRDNPAAAYQKAGIKILD
jgi:hypothetical protein